MSTGAPPAGGGDPPETKPAEPTAQGAATAPPGTPAAGAPEAPTVAATAEPSATGEPPVADASEGPATKAPPDSTPPRGSLPLASGSWGHLARALGYEVWVVAMTAVFVAVLAFAVFQGRFLDLYIKLRPGAPTSGEVTLLTIGGEALYLWNPDDPAPEVTPRALLAEMVRFLDAAGASVIVLDFLLDRPAAGDEALAAAARAHGRVIAAERLEVSEPASGRQFVAGVNPGLLGDIHGAYANFQVEQDTLFSEALLVRRVPLVRLADRSHLSGPWPANQVGGRQDVDQVMPALSLLAAALHRRPEADPDGLLRDLQAACGGRPLACADDALDFGLPPLPSPLTEPLPINFRGPEHADGIPVVDASRALRVGAQAALMESLGVASGIDVPEDLRAVLEGRVVVVGRVDAGSTDRFTTPYSLPVPIEADMAGPRIHAQVIDTLLSGRHVRTVNGSPSWIGAVLLAAGVFAARRRVPDEVLALGVLATAGLSFAGGVVLFHWTDGVAVDLGPPLLGLLGALFVHLVGQWAREQSRTHDR